MDNIIENINIRTMPVKVVKVDRLRERVDLLIGNLPAAIMEPRQALLYYGGVCLLTTDHDKADWKKLISTFIPTIGQQASVTDDPRIVEIAKKLCEWQLSGNEFYPPLEFE
ncbi:MAG: hypothetical protein LBF49_02280 [Puniceicoccales bacterium]|nr:hypothetical protein [Puniceicoccales bacterium]